MNEVMIPGMVNSKQESQDPTRIALGAGNEVGDGGWGRGSGVEVGVE